jgi:DNA-binding response OmpR family regulator
MKKLLLVEDDVTIATIYQNKFRVEDFMVEIAPDGKAGFELAHSFRPDIVVLDLMLPKMTGVELMQKLRAEPDFKELPFIVLSNTYMSTMVQEAWKAGATKCLSKTNCTPKQVIEIVLEVLASKKPIVEKKPSLVEKTEEEADSEFQADLRRTFLASLPNTLSSLRGILSNLAKASGESARLEQIQEL